MTREQLSLYLKNFFQIKNQILFALILALIAQVLNTSGLYQIFSSHQDPVKTIVAAFSAIALEYGVFICIRDGSKKAGAFFAVGLFFIGILFHNTWGNSEVIINWDTYKIERFYLERNFMASTLLQLLNSYLVYLFSERYVRHLKMIDLEAKLKQEEVEKLQREEQMKQMQNEMKQLRIDLEAQRKFGETAELQHRQLLEAMQKEHEASVKQLKQRINELEVIEHQFKNERTCKHCNALFETPYAMNAHRCSGKKEVKNLNGLTKI
jgi:hypothetical protein